MGVSFCIDTFTDGPQFSNMTVYLQKAGIMPKMKTHKGAKKRFRVSS